MRKAGMNSKGEKMLKLTKQEARHAYNRGYNIFTSVAQEYEESLCRWAGMFDTFDEAIQSMRTAAFNEGVELRNIEFYVSEGVWADC